MIPELTVKKVKNVQVSKQLPFKKETKIISEQKIKNNLKLDKIEKVMKLDDEEEKICSLCARNRPVFVVDTDNMIKRMPERHLSPLLKNIKKDFNNKRQYLKFLRIKVNFIHPCMCENKYVHSYCQTASVVRTQKIYCKDCGSYYHLYVKSEKLCS